MRLRSGIRCDVVVAAALAFAALLTFVPASWAAPPTETPADLHVAHSDADLIAIAWSPGEEPQVGATISWVRAGTSGPPNQSTVGQALEWWLEVRCGQTWTISVALQNADGVGPAATLTASSDPCDPGPPEPPGVTVSAVQGGSVELAWPDPVANDVAYAELRISRPGADFGSTKQEDPWSGGTVLTGLRCGTVYDVAATFVDDDDQRSEAAITHATTVPCDTLGPPPEALKNFRVIATTGSAVTLAWDRSARPGVVTTYVTLAGGSMTSGGASDADQPTQATMQVPPGCGDHVATVAVLYTDGRTSTPATLTLPGRRCPPTPPASTITRGPIPYHRAGITLRRQARVAVGRDGRFLFPADTVQCPPVGGSCRVTVRVDARIPGKRGLGPLVTVGIVDTTLTPGTVATVRGRLSPRGRAVLRRRGRLPVAVAIEAWHVAGLYAVTKHTTFVTARRQSRPLTAARPRAPRPPRPQAPARPAGSATR